MRNESCETFDAASAPARIGAALPLSLSARPKQPGTGRSSLFLRVRNYDLDATLDSGQAFRWQRQGRAWLGVIGQRPVRLTSSPDGIRAETAGPINDWQWLRDYLQSDLDLAAVLAAFPDDLPMRNAVAACRGLRILRQDPWECLASFILSSTKQIVQIRQIVSLLCERFGEPLGGGGLRSPENETLPAVADRRYRSFPTAERLAAVTEADLRGCKMGFRAPYLLAAARQIAGGKLNLERLRRLPLAAARDELVQLPGVGNKIADCVLLFAYGFDGAFPVDVWVERALRQLYFAHRRVGGKRLRHFAATHFGPRAGYAQQYLFHYIRIHKLDREGVKALK